MPAGPLCFVIILSKLQFREKNVFYILTIFSVHLQLYWPKRSSDLSLQRTEVTTLATYFNSHNSAS
jgi:hypothetical protein